MTRLANFILENVDQIIEEWEAFTHDLPVTGNQTRSIIRNRSREILAFIAKDMGTSQSQLQQKTKSRGGKHRESNSPDTAAEIHGALRLEDGFDIMQVVSEYRALRGSVIRLWMKDLEVVNESRLPDLIRFNEAIDQAVAESVTRFTKNLDTSKDLFLGILGHDLRNPLGVISMSAYLLKLKGPLNEKQDAFAMQIEGSAARLGEIITDLLDLTRARLGSGIPVEERPMNFADEAQRIVEEMRILHPTRSILMGTEGPMDGQGDPARIKQALSNLLGNAIQYSEEGSPITVTVKGNESSIDLSVHNMGKPIPASAINTIFESLVRGPDGDIEKRKASTNLGLGLYIAKMIVKAHGGDLSVRSDKATGTVFTAHFPLVSNSGS